MAIAHNGNLSNAAELRDSLSCPGYLSYYKRYRNDRLSCYKKRLHSGSIEEAVSRALPSLEGAYSLVLMSPQS